MCYLYLEREEINDVEPKKKGFPFFFGYLPPIPAAASSEATATREASTASRARGIIRKVGIRGSY